MANRFRQIVESELLNHYSLSEDAKADRALMNSAFDVFDEMVKRAKIKAEEIKPHLKNEILILDDCIDDLTCFYLDTEYGELVITIYSDSDEMEDGSYNQNRVIALNLYNIQSLGSEKDVYHVTSNMTFKKVEAMKIDTYLKYLRAGNTFRTFLHEFTHFVDNIRKTHIFQPKTSYYDRDAEKNAHFMDKMFYVTQYLINKYNRKALKDMTPEQRLSFLKDDWSKDEYFMNYYNKLKPEYRKRFLSRLYSYFSTDHWSKK